MPCSAEGSAMPLNSCQRGTFTQLSPKPYRAEPSCSCTSRAAAQHSAQLFPPHASPSLNACFLLVGNRQIFDRLRTSSCANSSCGVSSQADTMKARTLPKVNFESVYITEQRFLSRLHPHNSMVMHCNITAHLYLQPQDSLLMKQ